MSTKALYRPEQVAKITNTRNTDINNKAHSSQAQIDNTWAEAQAKNPMTVSRKQYLVFIFELTSSAALTACSRGY